MLWTPPLSPSFSASPSVSLLLHDRYVLHTRLSDTEGRPVWAAFDRLLEREVVIKGIEQGLEGEASASLAQEYLRLLVRRHPFLPEVYDFAVASHPERVFEPFPYFVQERLRGSTLDQLRGQLSWEALHELARQLLEGVAWLHASGLSRLDLKPIHLFQTENGWKLIDLDQAEQDDPSFRDPHGTVGYLAPEQASGASLGVQTDLYTVGLMLLESLPTSSPSAVEPAPDLPVWSSERAAEGLVLPRVLLRQAPRLWRLLRALLQKNAADRPGSAEEALTLLLASETLTFSQRCPSYTAWRREMPLPPVLMCARGRAQRMLEQRLEQLQALRGGVVQVVGRRGSGFTRFLQESLLPLQQRGVPVLWLSRLLPHKHEGGPFPAALNALLRALSWWGGTPLASTAVQARQERTLQDFWQNPERGAVETSVLQALLTLSQPFVSQTWPVLVVVDAEPVLDEVTLETLRALGPYLEGQQLILLMVQPSPESKEPVLLEPAASTLADASGSAESSAAEPDVGTLFEAHLPLEPLPADDVRRWIEQVLSERFVTSAAHLAAIMKVTGGLPGRVAERLWRHWQTGRGLDMEALGAPASPTEQGSGVGEQSLSSAESASAHAEGARLLERVPALLRTYKLRQVLALLEPHLTHAQSPLSRDDVQLMALFAFALQLTGKHPEAVASFDRAVAEAQALDPDAPLSSRVEWTRWRLRACWSLLAQKKPELVKERIQTLGSEGIPPEPSLEIEYEWYQFRLALDRESRPDLQSVAQRLYERAQHEGTSAQVMRLANHLALMAMQQRRYDDALSLLDELLSQHRREFLFIHEASTLHNRAAVLDELEEFRAAQVAMERAAQLHAYAGNEAAAFSNACDSVTLLYRIGAIERAEQQVTLLERSPWRQRHKLLTERKLSLLMAQRDLHRVMGRTLNKKTTQEQQAALRPILARLETVFHQEDVQQNRLLYLAYLVELAQLQLLLSAPFKVLQLLMNELSALDKLPSRWVRTRLQQLSDQAMEQHMAMKRVPTGVETLQTMRTPPETEAPPSSAHSTALPASEQHARENKRELRESPSTLHGSISARAGGLAPSVRPPLGSLRSARVVESASEEASVEESLLWLERLPRILALADDPEALAAELAELAGALLQGYGLMYVLDAEQPQIIRETELPPETPPELVSQVLAWVEREKVPLYISNLSHSWQRLQLSRRSYMPPLSVAALPILFEQTVLGVLYVQHAQPGVLMQARARTILEALARLAQQGLEQRLKRRRWARQEPSEFGLIGTSPAAEALRKRVQGVLQEGGDDLVIFLDGEIGVGKSLIARMIHKYGARSIRPYLSVNCGAVPEGIFESLMCGHLKGIFTGASHERAGWLEQAKGGVLFLDEVGETPITQQVKLLDILGERYFRRVGSIQPLPFDVHLISATNRSIKEMLESGRVRPDFVRRLHVNVVEVPPLRARGPEDIRLLSGTFIGQYLYGREAAASKPIPALEAYMVGAGIDLLYKYEWPWNIAELESLFRDVRVRAHLSTQGEQKIPRELVQEILSTNASLGGRSRVSDVYHPSNGGLHDGLHDSLNGGLNDWLNGGLNGGLSTSSKTAAETRGAGNHFTGAGNHFTGAGSSALTSGVASFNPKQNLSLKALEDQQLEEKYRYALQVLQHMNGNVAAAARALDCSRDVFYRAQERLKDKKITS
ncbi:MAG: sigma 54-interacting transcriptional regulator [Myxococcota bacterium]